MPQTVDEADRPGAAGFAGKIRVIDRELPLGQVGKKLAIPAVALISPIVDIISSWE
jgi:hypothetical protein